MKDIDEFGSTMDAIDARQRKSAREVHKKMVIVHRVGRQTASL